MPKLVIKYKSEILQEYIVGKKPISIGRTKRNNIILQNESVSEDHCKISYQEKKFIIQDLNTAFGTYVNGQPVTAQELRLGDTITIGDSVISFKALNKSKDKSAIAAGQPDAYLFGIQGKMEGKKFELAPIETRIGRSKEFNEVLIPKELDKSVSRRHTTIKFANGKFILTDRRSKNRTFVNQTQVGENDEITLKSGDEILIGKSIFRFIIGSKEDYAFPKKAGIFWIRQLPKIRKLIAMLILAAGIYVGYVGFNGLSIIASKPVEVYLDNLNWSPEGFKRSWSGFLAEDEFDVIPSPAIGDINNDGVIEVVASDASGKLYAWSAVSGNLIWQSELGQSKLTSPVLADINNDNILDVIVGSDNSRVYVLDGISGQILYKSAFIGGGVLFASAPLVDDFDGDGFKDIVVVSDDKVICFLYAPITDKKNPYYFRTPEDILSSPVLMKSVDGFNRIAVGTNGGKIYLFDSLNPENREVIDITHKINMLKGVNLVLNEISTIPAAADLDSDGIDDLVFATGAYYVAALNGRNKSLMWAYKIRPFSNFNTPTRYASPVVTDVDLNGDPDVILPWANGNIIALDGRYGEQIWEYNTKKSNRIIASPSLSDFNKDGIADLLVSGEDGKLFIIDPSPNAPQRALSNSVSVQSPITASAAVGDINGDGYLETVVMAVNNRIFVFATPTRVFKNQVTWSGFRNESNNSGSLFIDMRAGFYQILTVIGFVLLFIILLFSSLSKKKRLRRRPKVVDGRKK